MFWPKILLAAVSALAACAVSSSGEPSPIVVHQRSDPSKVPETVTTGEEARGDASAKRRLTQSGAWTGGGAVLPFEPERDREAARVAALEERASRRAFEGAPPVMPHSASFGAPSKACLDCHLAGMRMGDRVAHPMSHAPMLACTQCHVESVSRDLPAGPPRRSTFVGLASPGPGHRASPGAPPTIPHGVALRTRCLACHGEFGHPGLRTMHPQQAACTQCHVESSSLFGPVRPDAGPPLAGDPHGGEER